MFLFRYLKKLSIAFEFVNVGERLEANAYHNFGCLLVPNKIFEKLLRSRWVKLLDLQNGFRTSSWAADLLIVAVNRVASAFNISCISSIHISCSLCCNFHHIASRAIKSQLLFLIAPVLDSSFRTQFPITTSAQRICDVIESH